MQKLSIHRPEALLATGLLVLTIVLALPQRTGLAQPGVVELEQSLATAQKMLNDVGPGLEELVEARSIEIKQIEAQLKQEDSTALREQKDLLTEQLDQASARLEFLTAAARSWQEALDSAADRVHSVEALADLNSAIEQEAVSFVQADVDVAKKEISQVESTLETLEPSMLQVAERLQVLAELLAGEEVKARKVLEAERFALEGAQAAYAQRRAALEARINFLNARVRSARAALEQSAARSEVPEAESEEPSETDEAELRLKEKLAERLSQQARDELKEAQTRLDQLRQRRDANPDAGNGELKKWGAEIDFWRRKLEFAERKRQLAELRTRSATEDKKVKDLEGRVSEIRREQQQIEKLETSFFFGGADSRVTDLREDTEKERDAARLLEQREAEEREKVPVHEQLLEALDAQGKAIEEQFEESRDIEHYFRMADLLQKEVGQVRQLALEQKILVYALGEQARQHREMAELYELSADILDPPLSRWIADHASEIRAGTILLAALFATWILSLLGRLLVWVVSTFVRQIAPRMSVQRFRTLTGFAQSIIKVFLWVGVVIAVLKEFGIEPSKSTGAIGLIGLILAGMFQQIVLDFVKGIDIIVGRHYHVGDFVEVGGKFGHVLDFNAKYTRIRTPSGQQISIPNSECVPSRRFPDGFVDNYVDIRLASSGDAGKAKRTLTGVCREINERVEVVKEEPTFVDSFVGADGRGRVLRYLVRVLPGSDWVVKEYFVPRAKAALEEVEIRIDGEPTTVFMNGVERFRKLFSRELSEAEILEEAVDRPLEPVPEAPPTAVTNPPPDQETS